ILLNGKCLEPTLPYVPRGFVVAMVTPCMSRQYPLHPASQVAIAVRSHHEVEVIWHQTQAEDIHRQASTSIHHRVYECVGLSGFMENGTPPVTAVEHVVPYVRGRRSCGSGHFVRFQNGRPSRNDYSDPGTFGQVDQNHRLRALAAVA